MKEKLKSRKLWITVIGILVGVLYPPALPLIKILAPTYVGAQAIVDAAEKLKSVIATVKAARTTGGA